MLEWPDQRRHRPAMVFPDIVDDRGLAQFRSHFDLKPVDDEFVLFMTNGRACPTCLHKRNGIGRTPKLCLHVHHKGTLLVITHACDLHEPGEVLIAREIARYEEQSLYQLSGVLPDGMDIPGFRPAAGIAVLFLQDGRRHLTVFGALEGSEAPDDQIGETYEISFHDRSSDRGSL